MGGRSLYLDCLEMQSVLALQLNLGVSNDCVIVFLLYISMSCLFTNLFILSILNTISYTSLIPSLFFDWDRFGTDGFRIESIYRACSVR